MISRYAGRSIDRGSHVMLSKYRSLALCAFFVLPALLLSACGSDVPGNSVAKVGDQTIRRSTFDHWMQIAAVSAAGQTARQREIVFAKNLGLVPVAARPIIDCFFETA